MENKNKRNISKAQVRAESVAKAFVDESSFKNDPLGSYTGKVKSLAGSSFSNDPLGNYNGKTNSENDKPEQDADDL